MKSVKIEFKLKIDRSPKIKRALHLAGSKVNKIFKAMMKINRNMCILPHLVGDTELKFDHFDLLYLVPSDRNK